MTTALSSGRERADHHQHHHVLSTAGSVFRRVEAEIENREKHHEIITESGNKIEQRLYRGRQRHLFFSGELCGSTAMVMEVPSTTVICDRNDGGFHERRRRLQLDGSRGEGQR
ncbi:hypothetical protein PIB30_027871 [Stylosanthes scabra]|uniref:Uncharacterized protein n=1 Tax=Stylosanthes scabra TaxID=79078 RepID=A0ABU6W9C5_9FABA|nr:hypothetical protein [Stylosanthes scabra]